MLPTHYDNEAGQSLNLITGVMSGAADADQGPDWCDGTVIEHIRPGHNTITKRGIRVCRPGESN